MNIYFLFLLTKYLGAGLLGYMLSIYLRLFKKC